LELQAQIPPIFIILIYISQTYGYYSLVLNIRLQVSAKFNGC
jgi:hypothetical protein